MTTSAASQSKPDNLFGVCASIGGDLGFSPNWLRMALGAGILWNPLVVLATYAVMAVVVVSTRLLFPDAEPASGELFAEAPLTEAANGDEPPLPLAA